MQLHFNQFKSRQNSQSNLFHPRQFYWRLLNHISSLVLRSGTVEMTPSVNPDGKRFRPLCFLSLVSHSLFLVLKQLEAKPSETSGSPLLLARLLLTAKVEAN